VARLYLVGPDEAPDADSRFALVCHWFRRRLHDVGWVVVPLTILVILLAVLGIALLILGTVAALVVLVVRLMAAASSEPLPSLTSLLAALPGVAASIAGWAARRKIAAGVLWLWGRLTIAARFVTRPSSHPTPMLQDPQSEQEGSNPPEQIKDQSPV